MTYQTNWLDFLVYSITLIAGIDFLISGILILKSNIMLINRPKLLGVILMRRLIKGRPRKPNKLFDVFYAPKMLGYYNIIGGAMCVIGGLIGLVSFFYLL